MKQEAPERRQDLGPMEFFLLALIGRMGLGSLYALKQEAGLEPGGIRSALKRLVDGNFITRAEEGRRRRREMKLTDDGVEALDTWWTDCLLGEGEAESVLRVAFVAMIMGGPHAAADYLHRVGESRREGAERMQSELKHLEGSQRRPMSSYRWMRASLEARRQAAESEAFLSTSVWVEERFSSDANQ